MKTNSELKIKNRLIKKQEKFLQRIENTFKNRYTVLGQFYNVSVKVLIRHNECGYEWAVLPSNLFAGKSNCPRCSGKAKMTTKEYIDRVNSVANDEYDVLENYTNNYTKILMKHLVCGYEWRIKPQHVLDGSRCPRCQSRERYTTERIIEKIDLETNGEYELLDEYINNSTKMNIRHLICNKTSLLSITDFFLNDQRCLHCFGHMSKGERRIEEFLINKQIPFRTQYTFDDCKNINKLRFDFAVLDNLNQPIYLIEYDGKQHYEPIEFFNGEVGYKLTQKRDQIKNVYCIDNNIPLLRIPYWEDNNIETILHNALFKKSFILQQELLIVK